MEKTREATKLVPATELVVGELKAKKVSVRAWCLRGAATLRSATAKVVPIKHWCCGKLQTSNFRCVEVTMDSVDRGDCREGSTHHGVKPGDNVWVPVSSVKAL